MGKPIKKATKWVGEHVFGIEEPDDPPAHPDPEIARRAAEEESQSVNAERRRRIKTFGRSSTIASGSQGLVTNANIGKKKLLGQ